MKSSIIALACMVVLTTSLIIVPSAEAAKVSKSSVAINSKLNIVVFLTDDQRADTLQFMDNVKWRLQDRGITFDNAFVNYPLCCPERASFLSGGWYANDTGVLTNELPNGSAPKFNDTNTMATYLQQHGYKTSLIGKYMNHYPDGMAVQRYVPPGWSDWYGMGPGYKNPTVIIGSSTWDKPTVTTGVKLTNTNNTYSTWYIRDRAIDFINKNVNNPFFAYVAFNAPHEPAIPAVADQNKFANFTYSSPATEESDFSDKPNYIKQRVNATTPEKIQKIQDFAKNQVRSLQAVDRAIASIMTEIANKGLTDKTVFVFASDNGYLWGEHNGLSDKTSPYEESIRVPLVIKAPNAPWGKHVKEMISVNLDVPATIYQLAGITEAQTRGMSLLPLMYNEPVNWRTFMPFQGFGTLSNDVSQTWMAIRTEKMKYIEYPTGERELYNLTNDPYELDSQHNNPKYAEVMAELKAQMEPYEGLTITTQTWELPVATIGQPYSFQMKSWGGTVPFIWSISSGSLPAGLTMDNGGLISGVPTANDGSFTVTVTDNSTSHQNGRHQSYSQGYVISLREQS